MDWNQIFRLPDAALAGDRRIPKTVLVSQAGLTKHEQKILDKVSSVRHFATVQKSTTRILPCVDDERDIQGIVFLQCDMAGGSEAYAEVAKLLHKCFPNPTVIAFNGSGSACISVALTRKSLAEKGAVTVDGIEGTGAFRETNEAYRLFLESLAFDRLAQDDLFAFVSEIAWKVRLSRSIPALGFFPECSENNRVLFEGLTAKLDQLEKESSELAQLRKSNDLSMNKKAQIRMKQKGIEKELASVVASVKEICHG
ncbi:MAG: DUF4391 domain-containing protein [Coriobacteriaceae bacterium]|nr:DUF4391 domain-containing protein [Coriobacteriaceae bacterium]